MESQVPANDAALTSDRVSESSSKPSSSPRSILPGKCDVRKALQFTKVKADLKCSTVEVIKNK